MRFSRNEALKTRFLKNLCKIKHWEYNKEIERSKEEEIKEFLKNYLFPQQEVNNTYTKKPFRRLNLLMSHHAFKHRLEALIWLMEMAGNEERFIMLYKKATTGEQTIK
ncbi:MAG TPA: hypothetical protein VHB70_14290 [Parafilimonas sp.]|nr:hypothetical protein [Parafilimonas sp.]